MTRTIRPFALLFSHHVALACLCGFFIALSTLSGIAIAQNPVPLINQPLVPDAIAPGGAGFTLTVNGTGFVSGSVVKWNDSPRATTFVSQSRLTVHILSSDIAKPSTASLTVVNPTPGGGTSNVAFFEVTIASSAMVLTTSVLRAGVSPAAVAVGDFNGDGNLDMAVPNNASASVSILLGMGHGTFRPAVDYGLGFGSHHPNSAAVGDFNGDGKLDLVVANGGSNDVSVFLGNGDGTFGTPLQYGTNSDLDSVEPSSVTVGDFSRDGILDLAVANPGGLSVLLGNGDGTFKPFVIYAAGSTPFWVSAGDFNRDGKLDLVVANEGSNNISVLLGKGDGTFEAAVNYATRSQPASVAVGDFNADRKLDLAVTNLGSNSVSVFLGKGDGTFWSPVDYGAGSAPRWVTVGDVNGDGKLDLIAADSAVNGGTPGVSVLFGNGNGTFKSEVEYAVGSDPESVALGDFDGDGRIDMAVADMGNSSSQVFVLSASAIFADQLVGTTSPAHPVTLGNYGTQTLQISSIVASPIVFSQTNNCASSIPPGGYCTIDVTFAPTQRGPRTGTVSITDNAPDSPQKVYLAGAGTVVALDPPSLSFACSLNGNRCPPPPQPTTLTNTGSTALTISKITIAGQYFSETNNCPARLDPNKACTITVEFNPKSFGALNGTVFVFDNGGGSPQQVALSGTHTKRGTSTAARTALSMIQAAAVPAPTGPSQVGTQLMDLIDSSRDDQFLADGTKRELLVRFWYPASLAQGCMPAEYTPPAVWSYFSQLAKIPLPRVSTNSCMDAPITEGSHPVVVFTHGYTGTFTDYTFLAEDLASRGYGGEYRALARAQSDPFADRNQRLGRTPLPQ
jgi:FG-GAP-like repeat